MTAAKLPMLYALMRAGLAEGKSLVVGLLGTGEAYCSAEAPGESDALPPAPAAILRNVITAVLFPEALCRDEPQPINTEIDEELQRWLARAEALRLPANPLDAIMHTLQVPRARREVSCFLACVLT